MARQASSRRAAAGSSDRQDARRNAQVGSRTGRSRALLPRRDRKYTRTARGKRITSPASSARVPAPRPTVATHWPARSRSPVAAGSPPSAPPARCRPRPPGPTSMLDLPDSRSAVSSTTLAAVDPVRVIGQMPRVFRSYAFNRRGRRVCDRKRGRMGGVLGENRTSPRRHRVLLFPPEKAGDDR